MGLGIPFYSGRNRFREATAGGSSHTVMPRRAGVSYPHRDDLPSSAHPSIHKSVPREHPRYLENISTPAAFPQRLSACRAASGSVGL